MSCPYYTFKGGLFGGDYWCRLSDSSVNESMYSNYCKNYNYSNCSIYRKENPSSGCFITTVVHDILGKKDDCEILNNLRVFRDDVLQKNEKYHEYLQDYDNIGPVIADSLYHDKDREKMAKGIYDIALVPISNLVKQKKYDEAVEKYHVMTLCLINYYGLKHGYNYEKDNGIYEIDFVAEKAGHGKRLIKKYGC